VKRPILGLLAAAILSAGLLGAPAAQAHEGHDHDGGGYKYSHPDGGHHGTRHHHRDWGDHDHDRDGDHDHNGDGACRGLIVVCL
jgi:hypothetical protein